MLLLHKWVMGMTRFQMILYTRVLKLNSVLQKIWVLLQARVICHFTKLSATIGRFPMENDPK